MTPLDPNRDLLKPVTQADIRLALAESNLKLVTWITKWIMVTMGVALTGLFAALMPWLRP